MTDVNVPDGYKSTEIGVIPIDWEEYYLTELGILERGKSKHRPRWAEHLYGGNYPFIQTGEITAANKYVTSYIKTYSEAGLAQSKLWAKNTLCITIAANIAETALLKFSACFPDSILGFIPSSKKADVEFIFYTINYLQKRIKELVISSAQDNINLGTFQKIKFPFPPLPEQKAIARVLSDVDELITECDSLITKKRDIKQGTMQQLLTAKKRLPGFSGEWEVKKLGEIGKFKNGINKNKENFGFGYPFVNLLDVFGKNKLRDCLSLGLVNSTKYERSDYDLKKGDVLFVRSSVKPEGVGLTSVVVENLEDAVYSGFLIRFRDFNYLSLEYKEYCFYEENFRKKLIDNSTVSANTNINQEALKELTIFFPTLPEQKAIAQILSDMDAEIETLEKKRDKYKAIKQGMMQELLTGKTRIKGLIR